MNDHAFCRFALKEQMAEVRKFFTQEQIKKAWAIGTIGSSFEFHGPNGEYIYNLRSADCLWSAKAEGWAKLLDRKEEPK